MPNCRTVVLFYVFNTMLLFYASSHSFDILGYKVLNTQCGIRLPSLSASTLYSIIMFGLDCAADSI